MIPLQGRSRIIGHDEMVTLFRGTVSFVDGKPVAQREAKSLIRGTVQPLTGRDLLLVPEGDRTKEQYWFWTECNVMLMDRIERCGVNFQVQGVQNWGSFNQARMMRIDVGQYSSTCT